jgi:hypothetical protein
VVDNSCTCYRLACTRWTLNKAKRLLEGFSNCLLLIKIEFRKAGCSNFIGHFYVKLRLGPGLTQDSMIKITRYRSMVIFKLSETLFHSLICCWLPYKFYFVGIILLGVLLIVKQLETHLLISCNLRNDTFRGPAIFIGNFELITWQKTGINIFSTTKHKVGIFLTMNSIESNLHIVLGLALLDSFVSLRFFDK